MPTHSTSVAVNPTFPDDISYIRRSAAVQRAIPLAVDLDGTLIRSDVSLESAIAFLLCFPLQGWRLPMWLLREGRAGMKDRIYRMLLSGNPARVRMRIARGDTGAVASADGCNPPVLSPPQWPDAHTLPYDDSFLAWLRAERAAGRRLVLATASHIAYAEAVIAHLNQIEQARTGYDLFERVLASDATHNLAAAAKRVRLVEEYGARGFDYAGNSRDDLTVWSAARRIVVVNPNRGVLAALRRQYGAWAASIVVGEEDRSMPLRAPPLHGPAREEAFSTPTSPRQDAQGIERIFLTRPPFWPTLARALRLHQWLKNGLICLPLLAAHLPGLPASAGLVVLALLLFGLTASGGYLFNDLCDLPHDRAALRPAHDTNETPLHSTRCRWFARAALRPLAVGDLPLHPALALSFALPIFAVIVAGFCLPPACAVLLAVYTLLSVVYTVWGKFLLLGDAVILALLYILRLLVGAAAVGVTLSFWLLAFSLFFFFSLALAKRYTRVLAGSTEAGCLPSKSVVPVASLPPSISSKGHAASGGSMRWQVRDLTLLATLGCTTGGIAVLVLALYIQEAHTLYRTPQLIWLACPLLLYWIARLWLLTSRGVLHTDPVVFAWCDRTSWIVGVLGLAIFWVAV